LVAQNRASSRFAVQVVTNDAHIMCAMWTTCPDGYMHAGTNIHSHCPAKRVLRANAADMAMSGNRYKLGDRLKPCVDDRFSAMDFDAGPGYLATPRRLLSQTGRKQLADLGPLPPDATPPPAAGRPRARRAGRRAAARGGRAPPPGRPRAAPPGARPRRGARAPPARAPRGPAAPPPGSAPASSIDAASHYPPPG